MGRAPTVQVLAEALATRSQLPSNALDDEVCHELMRFHERRIKRDLERVAATAVGKNAAFSLIHYLCETVEAPVLLGIAASQYLDPAELSEIVTRWIVEKKPDLEDHDWKALQNLARQGRDMRLLHLSATLGRRVDAKVRDEALGSMNAHTFRKTMEHLMNPIEPAHFVVPVHLPLLLSDPRLDDMSGEQFLDLVKAIVKVGAADQLNALTHLTRSLPYKPLT